MKWLIDPIKNHYADFSGRASRKEYWMFMLVYIGCSIVAGFAYSFLAAFLGKLFSVIGMIAFFTAFVGTVVPTIALQVRRLHDIGQSGWWYFFGFIPYVGGMVLLIMSALPSKPDTNEYGPNPYGDVSNTTTDTAATLVG
jgi:uncharacterized membrane protein YhaH (DUF805 family)